jgi:Nucleotidyl transferase AbiEii toxin, Type IV TA system
MSDDSGKTTGPHVSHHQQTKRQPRNIVASVNARLLMLAKERNEEFQLVLMRYGLERLLYRLGQSPYASQFVVKGAILFSLWAAEALKSATDASGGAATTPSAENAHALLRLQRATHDLDLLGFGLSDLPRLERVFRDLCQLTVAEDDGLTFLPESVQAAPIREDQEYGGVRTHLRAMLGKARIPLQVDVGFGDVVTPAPASTNFPTLLPMLPAPQVRVYPRETVVAEKFEAIVRLGVPNTRMKDFYDLWTLANQFAFEGDQLCAALAATFARRGMALPTADEEPVAFTSRFGGDSTKRAQWAAFLRKGQLAVDAKPELPDVLAALRMFLLPPSAAIAAGQAFVWTWPPGGPWDNADRSGAAT